MKTKDKCPNCQGWGCEECSESGYKTPPVEIGYLQPDWDDDLPQDRLNDILRNKLNEALTALNATIKAVNKLESKEV